MGRRNRKIPGSRVKSQKKSKQSTQLSTVEPMMEGQEKLKQYNELSTEELKGLKNTILKRYEEYINSDAQKKKQIISQILAKYKLINNVENRQRIVCFISYQKRRRERMETKGTQMPIEEPKCRDILSRGLLEEIKKFIVDNNLHTDYLEADANNENYKKINIIKKY